MRATPRLRLLVGGVALVAATGGCGRQSALARPAPLFGEQAKADYQDEQDAAARAAARREQARRAGRPAGTSPGARATTGDSSATDQSSVDPGNAPPTTRDVQDPAQKLTPLSHDPAAGAPDPLGPPTSPSSPY